MDGSAGMQYSRALKALSDVTRIQILEFLTEGEHCVTDLVERLAVDQPKVSHHLGILRGAGVIRSRRDGRHIRYSLRPTAHRRVAGPTGEETDIFQILPDLSVCIRFSRQVKETVLPPPPPSDEPLESGAV